MPSRLSETLRAAPVLRLRNYDYFVHPITDGLPNVDASLLEDVVAGLKRLLPPTFDRMLAPEAMGLPLAAGLGLSTRRPFLVARKRAYGLPGEVVVKQTTGYGASSFHVVGLKPDERIVIVDDVISTGNTIRALAQACHQAGARLEKVVAAINKNHDLVALAREIGAPVEALVRIRIEGGRVVLEE